MLSRAKASKIQKFKTLNQTTTNKTPFLRLLGERKLLIKIIYNFMANRGALNPALGESEENVISRPSIVG